jgi:erythromycin esterase-like protein
VNYEELLARAGRARFALLGEASHGTREFYRERAELTKRLIVEHGCAAVAAEADWPDAYRANCWVRGESGDETADEALGDFRRFPAWMWRNREVESFLEWLRDYNLERPAEERVGFYGLDLYSLHASIEEVVRYLDEVDPEAAARARRRYSCFDDVGDDPQAYAYSREDCEDAVVAQLLELQRLRSSAAVLDADRHFYAEQNARLVLDAERYYRSVFAGRSASWNLRDRHMVETLEAIEQHLGGARIAVWAHNSHLGDARATESARRGELNVGQLVRERHADDAFLVGFSTDRGTVTAASDWGGEAERKRVRPGLPGSYEELFRQRGPREAVVFPALQGELAQPRLERAIGVIYRPETERQSHYFGANLARQFDAFVWIDETSALEPLERTSEWERGELPETYPSAL